MKKQKISEVLNNLNEDVIKEAIAYEKQPVSHRPRIIKIIAVCAACLVLIASGAFIFLKLQSEKTYITYIGGVEREYKKTGEVSYTEDVAYIWPWEYLDLHSQYTHVDFNGKKYTRHSANVDKSHIGESLGVIEAFGFDPIDDDKQYSKSFEFFKVNAISGDTFIAAYMGDRYVLFKDDGYTPPATLGEFINQFDLTKNLELKCFYDYKSNERLDYYKTPDSEDIWEQLIKCADTPLCEEEIDLWLSAKRDFIAFDLESDLLGIYVGLGGVDVTTDGYLEFSMFGRDHTYYIGEDAANNIISIAKKNATKSKREQYENVTGYVTAIEKDYILVDDSAFCKNTEDGMVFKITVGEKRLKGYVEVEELEVGDLVCVEFKGMVDTDNGNLITNVYNINQARLINIDEDEYEVYY